jgi:hypothetical protein
VNAVPSPSASVVVGPGAMLQSMAWQALGSAATIGAAGWVSWRHGLAAQGEFGLAKSWFDAAAVMAALGLPQGLLHLQYRLGVPAGALLRWLSGAVVLLALSAVVLAGVASAAGQPLVALVLLSVPFAVAHLCARSLLLARRGSAVFGAASALPALLVLAGVVLPELGGTAWPFATVLLGAAVLTGAATSTWAWHSARPLQRTVWPSAQLWGVALQSYLQAALGALLAAALLSTVAAAGHTGPSLGAASLGMYLYQLLAVAAGYAAPVLFDRLARQDRPTLGAWPAPMQRTAVGLLLAAALGVLGSTWSPALAPWLLPVSLMLPAGLAAVAARVAGTVLLARGAYAELSLQAAWRLVVAAGLTFLLLRVLPAAASVALALAVVEALTWWRSAVLVRRPVA